MERQAQDVLHVGADWCCPSDPSSTSVLHNQAMRAWAGDTQPLEETFEPWLWNPETTDFAIKASWAPQGGHATHTVDLFRSAPSQGKAAGTQTLPDPPKQGPAYVVPRLETVSAESSADLLVLPVENFWPYQIDTKGAHEDQVETEITYLRSSPGDSGTAQVEMQGYTELTGAARPAMSVSFHEPDWQELEDAVDRIDLDGEDPKRLFTQVLSKDDLISERTIHDDVTQLEEDGTFPHHRFHVQVNLTGPGAIDAGTINTADHGETRNLSEAYRLTIHVPRNWTEVEITPEPGDAQFNEEHNWSNTKVEELDSGGHRITSFLNVTAEFDQTGTRQADGPRWVLNDSTEIQAPFRFHARPPDEASSTELGFQDIQATVESRRFTARDTADLTVEVTTSPGRVHRTLDTHAPQLIPATPWNETEAAFPDGVRVPLGAVLENGGESTVVQSITWTIPQSHDLLNSLYDPEPEKDLLDDFLELQVLEDYTGRDRNHWRYEPTSDGLAVTWAPGLDTVDTTCDQLQACAVAAELTLDGRGLNQGTLWARPQLVSLYEDRDASQYVDWFVRSERAWDGIRLEDDYTPGFSIAHRYPEADAGPAEGAYRFTAPPSTTPACTEQEIHERDQADRRRRDDRVFYDFGPRENGIPHVAPSGLEACSLEAWNFTAIGKMGLRWTTDAIGKQTYRSVADLSGQTVSSWQNGLAESDLSANDTVPVGKMLNFSVKMDSLYDTLAVDDSVGNATVRAHVFDPYNAWEEAPWLEILIRENTGFGEVGGDATENFHPQSHSSGEACSEHETHKLECQSADTGDPIPPRYYAEVEVPSDTVPGTHLLVVEITWEFTTAGGTQLTETGRLIEPFDVVSVAGYRVQGAAFGMTAWDSDWR